MPYLQVSPVTLISEIKLGVAEKLGIPINEQKLLLLGRTLSDEQTVGSYLTIKEGTKLNLVVMKPDGPFEASVKYFKGIGMNDAQAVSASNELLKVLEEKIYKMSWDDLDRLCYDILLEEGGQSRPVTHQVESEPECEDSFTLWPITNPLEYILRTLVIIFKKLTDADTIFADTYVNPCWFLF